MTTEPFEYDRNANGDYDRKATEEIEAKIDEWRPLSWSAIIFGTILALGLSILLHVLGIGITATILDATNRTSDHIVMVSGVSALLFLISTAVSLFVGGFVASSLSRTFSSGRAAIYGLGVWALSTLITMAVLAPVLIRGAGAAANTAGTVVDRAISTLGGIGNTAAQSAQNAPAGLDSRIERILIGTSQPVDPNAAHDITTLVAQRLTQGNWTPQQRDQLDKAIARAANIPAEDAHRRVDEAQTTINSTLEEAQQALRRAAETARAAVEGTAYALAISMLIGLLAALAGAYFGELDEDDLPSFARMRFRGPIARESA
jgi:hypothetical protein